MSGFGTRLVGRNLQAQVTTASVVFCLVVGLLSIAMLSSIHWMLAQSQAALASNAEHCRLADAIAIGALQSRRHEEDLFLRIDDAQERKRSLRGWAQSTAALDETLAAFEATSMSDEECILLELSRRLHNEYRNGFKEVARAIEAGQIRTSAEANSAGEKYKSSIRELTLAAEEIGSLNVQDLTGEMSLLANRMSCSAVVMCVLFGSILATVLIFKWWFQRSVLARIALLHQAVSRFAEGNLAARAPVSFPDELGLIAGQFNTMARNLESQHADLIQAKEVADTSNRTKDEFLANISHELRTPLHGILSYAKFGVDEVQTSEREELQSYFATICTCSQALLALVNDLLDLAKLEAGRMRMQFQPSSIVPVVAVVVDEFDSLCSDKNIHIRLQEPFDDIELNMDAERIKQVLRNLLANAVRYSPAGGDVLVSVHHETGFARVSVADSGPGVPPAELEAIFDKFVQSSKTKSGSGGTGLGLAICRQIVTGHRGRIWAENGAQQGAVLNFEIPVDLEVTSEEEALLEVTTESE